jgi:hypothetical protein
MGHPWRSVTSAAFLCDVLQLQNAGFLRTAFKSKKPSLAYAADNAFFTLHFISSLRQGGDVKGVVPFLSTA